MIAQARTRYIDKTADPELASARTKQVVTLSVVGTKCQRMTEGSLKANGQQLAIYEGGHAMTVTEELFKSCVEATTTSLSSDE
ncbi:hypothetical protein Pcac1_g5409 [Phytophthora cactorum]|nr:hypothetical protein Pcac1_g5409 [Phytophthora cactorum]